jgi:hypothetical protein
MPKIEVSAESFDLRRYPHLSDMSSDTLDDHEIRVSTICSFEKWDEQTARELVRFRNWMGVRALVKRTA